MASSVAAFSASSTGLSSVSRAMFEATRMSPESAAIRASSGISWAIWKTSVRKCCPAETRSKPRSRHSAVCATAWSTIVRGDTESGCCTLRKMPIRGSLTARAPWSAAAGCRGGCSIVQRHRPIHLPHAQPVSARGGRISRRSRGARRPAPAPSPRSRSSAPAARANAPRQSCPPGRAV